ncbi:MAG: DUF1127 domain-containing protein [Alphaproteobacteria bacterium]|nr:DUF1127 domain-containing protein [Alphaproteobacteria bacterium]
MATVNTYAAFGGNVVAKSNIFARLVNAVKDSLVAARTYNELNALTDAQLRDIGIYRSDIPAIALGKK